MSRIASKIVIGTAQFGLNYGINNLIGEVSSESISNILDLANQNGIFMLDTSPMYGNSEEKIGYYFRHNQKRIDIVTKLPDCMPHEVEHFFSISFNKLGIEHIYGLLIHHFNHFYETPELFNELINLKKKGVVEKIGFSLYHPNELEYLLEQNIQFDIVQLPLNIFDQRFLPYLEFLSKQKIEVHIRSAFLQGLLLMEKHKIIEKFPSLENKITTISGICREYNVGIIELSLGFLFHNKFIDKIVLGVDSVFQLQEILEFRFPQFSDSLYRILGDLKEENHNIILPYNWK